MRSTNAAERRAVAVAHYTKHNPLPPRPEVLEEQRIEILGELALLTVERVSSQRIRATVCVYLDPPRGDLRGTFCNVWSFSAAMHEASHRVAREALVRHGVRPEFEYRWSIAFLAEGDLVELAPENDR